MKYKYILFDLDGTLTDPGEGITNSVAYSLKKFGIEVEDKTELYKFIGPPLVDSFKEFYGFSDDKAWQGVEYYREYFADKGIFENKVYKDITKVLETLRNKGYHLLIATSKPTNYAVKILEEFNLAGYFDFVSGSDMNEKNSNKSEIIRYALDMNNIAPEEAVMIGDRKHDIIGAKANGVHSIGVLYGYGDMQELQMACADDIAQTVEMILEYL